MKKFNLLFQSSTVIAMLVAGLFTYGQAQNADSKSKSQKLKIDIEVSENGETKKISKELDAVDGEDIQAILRELDVLKDIDIQGTGERIEIKVKKEVGGDTSKDLKVRVFGDEDLTWFDDMEEEDTKAQLGVFISTYDENGIRGALVIDIVEGSAAEKAGFKEDDVIIEVDDDPVTSEQALRDLIASKNVGDEIIVKYLRDGVQQEEKVTLGESKNIRVFKRQFDPNDKQFFFDHGINMDEEFMEQLKDMNFDLDVKDNEMPFLGVTPGKQTDAEGVELGSVVEGSAAEKMGLQAGDRVLKLDGSSVSDFKEVSALIAKKKVGDELTVEFERDGKVSSAKGELGKRSLAPHHTRIMRYAPDVVKEVNVVIELKDCSKEEEAMLAKPASVNFKKDLPKNKIEFAPNPSNGQFNLMFELAEDKDTRVLIFDQSGRKIYEEILNNFDGRYRNHIDISMHPSGMYFLIIAQGEKQFTRKLVKQ